MLNIIILSKYIKLIGVAHNNDLKLNTTHLCDIIYNYLFLDLCFIATSIVIL